MEIKCQQARQLLELIKEAYTDMDKAYEQTLQTFDIVDFRKTTTRIDELLFVIREGMFGYISPDTRLMYINKLLSKINIEPDPPTRGISGLDAFQASSILREMGGIETPISWSIRNELFEKTKEGKFGHSSLLASIAGINSERAWEIREDFLEERKFDGLGGSLVSLDSARASEMRNKLWQGCGHEDPIEIGSSLMGLNTKEAWEWRGKLLDMIEVNNEKALGALLLSIIGIDSQKAWDIRDRFFDDTEEAKFFVMISLIGIDSQKAWDIRDRFLSAINEYEENDYWDVLGNSVAGIDTRQAWRMRKLAMNKLERKSNIASSLATLNSPRAWAFRTKMLEDGIFDDDDFLESLSGGPWCIVLDKMKKERLEELLKKHVI